MLNGVQIKVSVIEDFHYASFVNECPHIVPNNSLEWYIIVRLKSWVVSVCKSQ
jgi:hypothetical protein